MNLSTRQVVHACITVLIGTLLGAAAVEFGLRYYTRYVQSQEQMTPGMLVYDPQLGWRMAANWQGRHVHFDFDVRYSTNDRGLRGANWPRPTGSERIAVLGDSFTFGLGVNDDETFVQLLNAGGSGATYLNVGIAGYSTDQQLLYLRDRLATWQVDQLVLVVYLANDLLDNRLRFPLQAEMGKPLFLTGPSGLQLTNVADPTGPKPPEERARTLATEVLGRELPGTWRNQWQITRSLGLTESAEPELLAGMAGRLAEPVDLFVQLVAGIRSLCTANNVGLRLVLMPGRSHVEMPSSLSAAFQDELRRQIIARHEDLGTPPIDLASRLRERFAATGEHLFFPNEGHLNPAGHRAVAQLLRKALQPDLPDHRPGGTAGRPIAGRAAPDAVPAQPPAPQDPRAEP
jgi:lysophospholipase L1-like esterase